MLVLKSIFAPFASKYLQERKNAQWRKMNRHNLTTISYNSPMNIIRVGKGTYGHINAHWYGSNEEQLNIGNFCSIASNVNFVLGGEHNYKRATNYPFPELKYHTQYDGVCKGPINIEDDVWIGYGATILSGVTLGRGCIVGAGSVVAKNIPSYAIYAGNRILKYRFSDEIIDKLKKIDFNNINVKNYEKYSQYEITIENVDAVVESMTLNNRGN
ncbi:CatB-related O-acetyltransferase [Anaerocolumna xylanovorans]|uniref:Acetyltransferase (Isoleucine patch superfamily) n=1 Tax=Anaerocolumna xylanovorans DSM 12503 TaxID=1121345 RepID=A0A1M7YIC6_9FIRM|nr:CatB-related O-acetyltransferase [Anaerocolumna xylanovorans]SHO52387.1 Acetyltransferase (isoleucine patch superfamily) [Anaerocolumna xylanovorans DSM 12503]